MPVHCCLVEQWDTILSTLRNPHHFTEDYVPLTWTREHFFINVYYFSAGNTSLECTAQASQSHMQANGIPKLDFSIWLNFCLYDSCSLNSYALVKTKIICDCVHIFINLFYKCTQRFKAESVLKVLKETMGHFQNIASTSVCLAYLHQKDNEMK